MIKKSIVYISLVLMASCKKEEPVFNPLQDNLQGKWTLTHYTDTAGVYHEAIHDYMWWMNIKLDRIKSKRSLDKSSNKVYCISPSDNKFLNRRAVETRYIFNWNSDETFTIMEPEDTVFVSYTFKKR